MKKLILSFIISLNMTSLHAMMDVDKPSIEKQWVQYLEKILNEGWSNPAQQTLQKVVSANPYIVNQLIQFPAITLYKPFERTGMHSFEYEAFRDANPQLQLQPFKTMPQGIDWLRVPTSKPAIVPTKYTLDCAVIISYRRFYSYWYPKKYISTLFEHIKSAMVPGPFGLLDFVVRNNGQSPDLKSTLTNLKQHITKEIINNHTVFRYWSEKKFNPDATIDMKPSMLEESGELFWITLIDTMVKAAIESNNIALLKSLSTIDFTFITYIGNKKTRESKGAYKKLYGLRVYKKVFPFRDSLTKHFKLANTKSMLKTIFNSLLGGKLQKNRITNVKYINKKNLSEWERGELSEEKRVDGLLKKAGKHYTKKKVLRPDILYLDTDYTKLIPGESVLFSGIEKPGSPKKIVAMCAKLIKESNNVAQINLLNSILPPEWVSGITLEILDDLLSSYHKPSGEEIKKALMHYTALTSDTEYLNIMPKEDAIALLTHKAFDSVGSEELAGKLLAALFDMGNSFKYFYQEYLFGTSEAATNFKKLLTKAPKKLLQKIFPEYTYGFVRKSKSPLEKLCFIYHRIIMGDNKTQEFYRENVQKIEQRKIEDIVKSLTQELIAKQPLHKQLQDAINSQHPAHIQTLVYLMSASDLNRTMQNLNPNTPNAANITLAIKEEILRKGGLPPPAAKKPFIPPYIAPEAALPEKIKIGIPVQAPPKKPGPRTQSLYALVRGFERGPKAKRPGIKIAIETILKKDVVPKNFARTLKDIRSPELFEAFIQHKGSEISLDIALELIANKRKGPVFLGAMQKFAAQNYQKHLATLLAQALKEKKLSAVQVLLKQNIDKNTLSQIFATLDNKENIQLFADNNLVSTEELIDLLERQPDLFPEIKQEILNELLKKAVAKNKTSIVQQLVAQGAQTKTVAKVKISNAQVLRALNYSDEQLLKKFSENLDNEKLCKSILVDFKKKENKVFLLNQCLFHAAKANNKKIMKLCKRAGAIPKQILNNFLDNEKEIETIKNIITQFKSYRNMLENVLLAAVEKNKSEIVKHLLSTVDFAPEIIVKAFAQAKSKTMLQQFINIKEDVIGPNIILERVKSIVEDKNQAQLSELVKAIENSKHKTTNLNMQNKDQESLLDVIVKNFEKIKDKRILQYLLQKVEENIKREGFAKAQDLSVFSEFLGFSKAIDHNFIVATFSEWMKQDNKKQFDALLSAIEKRQPNEKKQQLLNRLLHKSITQQKAALVQRLLKMTADPNAKLAGQTALDVALEKALKTNNAQITNIISSSPLTTDATKQKAFLSATKPQVMRYLIKTKQITNDDLIIRHYEKLLKEKKFDLVKAIVEETTVFDSTDNGKSMLDIAVEQRNAPLASFLLTKTTDNNIKLKAFRSIKTQALYNTFVKDSYIAGIERNRLAKIEKEKERKAQIEREKQAELERKAREEKEERDRLAEQKRIDAEKAQREKEAAEKKAREDAERKRIEAEKRLKEEQERERERQAVLRRKEQEEKERLAKLEAEKQAEKERKEQEQIKQRETRRLEQEKIQQEKEAKKEAFRKQLEAKLKLKRGPVTKPVPQKVEEKIRLIDIRRSRPVRADIKRPTSRRAKRRIEREKIKQRETRRLEQEKIQQEKEAKKEAFRKQLEAKLKLKRGPVTKPVPQKVEEKIRLIDIRRSHPVRADIKRPASRRAKRRIRREKKAAEQKKEAERRLQEQKRKEEQTLLEQQLRILDEVDKKQKAQVTVIPVKVDLEIKRKAEQRRIAKEEAERKLQEERLKEAEEQLAREQAELEAQRIKEQKRLRLEQERKRREREKEKRRRKAIEKEQAREAAALKRAEEQQRRLREKAREEQQRKALKEKQEREAREAAEQDLSEELKEQRAERERAKRRKRLTQERLKREKATIGRKEKYLTPLERARLKKLSPLELSRQKSKPQTQELTPLERQRLSGLSPLEKLRAEAKMKKKSEKQKALIDPTGKVKIEGPALKKKVAVALPTDIEKFPDVPRRKEQDLPDKGKILEEFGFKFPSVPQGEPGITATGIKVPTTPSPDQQPTDEIDELIESLEMLTIKLSELSVPLTNLEQN